jgi:molybdate-binding protein
VAIETVARQANLGFLRLREEHFDFVLPESHGKRDAVLSFIANLGKESIRNSLIDMGFSR